jgi:hypothetical protein
VKPRKRILLYYPNAEKASELAFKLNLMMQATTVTALHLERDLMGKLPDGKWDGVVLITPSEALEKVVTDMRLPLLITRSLVIDMAALRKNIGIVARRRRGPVVAHRCPQRLEVA